jgi:glycosyltransferase involved in cell wall biosynthesis
MLSIIIPTLNEEKYLPHLLDSIKNQNFSDYEVIISDGGSIDKTVSIAKSYGASVVVNSSVMHPAAQRNNGAAIARGDILLFLDADSVLPPGFLKNAHQEFINRELTAAGFFFVFSPNRWYYNIYSFISNLICFLKQNSKHPAAVGVGLMSKRNVHEKIKGFDLSILLAEDYDYCARLAEQGKFRIIRSIKIISSSRRIVQEGFWVTGWKYFRMGLFTLTGRKIRKQIVKYDFGKF